jgi:hypothetical protein
MSKLDLILEKTQLLNDANELQEIIKQKFPDVKISDPLSNEEKELRYKLAGIYSRINSLVVQIRKFKY